MTEAELREKLKVLEIHPAQGTTMVSSNNTDYFVTLSDADIDAVLALLHSAEAESYRRGQIDEFEKVFGTNGLVGDWANVPTEWVRKRRAELATSAQDDGGDDA